MKLITDTPD